MNRVFLSTLCASVFIASAAGCSGGDTSDSTVSSGTYVIDADAAEGSFLPSVTLDDTDHSFHISHDPLSSTYIGGTYSIDGDILSCETDDGASNRYLFRIEDEHTLVFIQNGSSELKPMLEDHTVSVTDGSVFSIR